MKKIKLYIAASLDSYIARPDGNLDWLLKYPTPEGSAYGYHEFYDSIDTIIMGNSTYQEILGMSTDWPYKDSMTYVLTRCKDNLPRKENICCITGDIIATIRQLLQQEGKDIWLMGGGQAITLLLNNEMVDEMQICYIPVILGEGIPLFPNKPKETEWTLTDSAAYDTGILKVTYRKV